MTVLKSSDWFLERLSLICFMIMMMVVMVIMVVTMRMTMMMMVMVLVVGGWMTKGGSATQLNKVCNSANSVNCTQVEESIPSQTIDRAANVEISNHNL